MPAPEQPIGEKIKSAQLGNVVVGTVEQIIRAAPADIVEEVVPIPEWKTEDGTTIIAVKLRSFTSAQSARIRKRQYSQKGDQVEINWAAWELAQFEEGVIEPKFDANQTRALHEVSGKGFQRIISWLDEKSGIKKNEERDTQEAFQEEQGSHQD